MVRLGAAPPTVTDRNQLLINQIFLRKNVHLLEEQPPPKAVAEESEVERSRLRANSPATLYVLLIQKQVVPVEGGINRKQVMLGEDIEEKRQSPFTSGDSASKGRWKCSKTSLVRW